jgi:ketosteroid isomerase-like protein
MTPNKNAELIRRIFSAIEQRDRTSLGELFHPEIEFHWAPSLPYAKNVRERPGAGPTWAETWIPLQPTPAERKMDFRIVASNDAANEVVVQWQQRGVTADGARFDGPVLGLYRVRDGKLARAQMFHFDTAELVTFLARADLPLSHGSIRAS